MVTFWLKVLVLAGCLAGVIAAQMYLSDIASHGSFNVTHDDSDRVIPPLEVETPSTQAVNETQVEKSNQ